MQVFRRTVTLASALLLASAQMASIAVPPAARVAQLVTQSERRSISSAMSGGLRSQRRRGPGGTNKHVQRMASKRRGVTRNRKAHRG